MRLSWYWRGIDLIDVEVHVNQVSVLLFNPRPDETDEGPTLRATGFLAGSEIAETIEPDTSTFGFSR